MGNIVVDIEGLARVIKPLILRLKRKASTCLGPGSALGGGGGGGGRKKKKNGRRRKPNRGASREVFSLLHSRFKCRHATLSLRAVCMGIILYVLLLNVTFLDTSGCRSL